MEEKAQKYKFNYFSGVISTHTYFSIFDYKNSGIGTYVFVIFFPILLQEIFIMLPRSLDYI